MSNLFSQYPGHRERYLQRKFNNPLFADQAISIQEIEQAKAADASEAENFLNTFRDSVKRAVDFKSNADSDVILSFKEQLDKSYEQCAGLAGDQAEVKQMLQRLIQVVMQAIWKGIGNDPVAQQKLEMEEQARQQHFGLLQQPLIADLLRPDSLIGEQDIAATLLSESASALQAAMQIFTPQQQIMLYQQASELLKNKDLAHPKVQQAKTRLLEMQNCLQAGNTRPN